MRASYVWRSRGGEPWLLTFSLLELEGRLECVGLEIRSYAMPEEDVSEGVGAARTGAHVVQDDQEAVASGFVDLPAAPRPLRAVTLRQLDFAGALARARRTIARDFRSDAAAMRAGGGDPRGAAILDAASAHLDPPETKTGRHAKYSRRDLETVARLYRAAYAGGSTSPTKDVADELELTRDQAAKLVMRCRRIGLLEPTERRKAGGIRPTAPDEERSQET